MRITHRYNRRDPYPEGETVEESVVGVDTGTKNFCVGRLSRLEPSGRYVMDNAAVVDIRGIDFKSDIDTVGDNLRKLFAHADMQWFWTPASHVTSERQVDQIQAVMQGDNKMGKKRPYKPPIMFAIYGMVQQIVCAHADPALYMDDDAWQTLELQGITPEMLKRPGIVWVPRSGSQKAGLEGIIGDDRKVKTLTVGPEYARKQKDFAAAKFMESLESQKPREDVCDIYLQLHRYLDDHKAEATKKRKRREREDKAEAKRAAKRPRLKSVPSAPTVVTAKPKAPTAIRITLDSSSDDDTFDFTAELHAALERGKKNSSLKNNQLLKR